MESHDGGDRAVHAPGDPALLPRAEGVRPGRHTDGGEGVTGLKIVVVGGGSTYTPELVSGLAARQDALPVDELVLLDPDGDRLEGVGALGGPALDSRGW